MVPFFWLQIGIYDVCIYRTILYTNYCDHSGAHLRTIIEVPMGKRWIDLSSFGVKAVVSSATTQRDKVGMLIIENPALFTNKTGMKIDDFLLNAQAKGAILVESEFPNSKPTLLLDPDRHSFNTALLKQIIPGVDGSHLRDMENSEIYINHADNANKVKDWVNVVSQGLNREQVVYIDTSAQGLKASLQEAFRDFDHDKKAELFFEHYEADAFPLSQLESYGYKSDKTLISYYPSEDIANAAGADLMALKKVILPPTSLPIKSNNQGQVLAFTDISQIPEMMNYNVAEHGGWQSLYNLPQAVTLNHNAIAYFDEKIKTLDELSSNLNEENVSELLSGLAETNGYVNKVLYDRFADLKHNPVNEERFDIVSKDGAFKFQHSVCRDTSKWEVLKEENINRTNFSVALNDLYVRLSEIHSPINALRPHFRKDFKAFANSLTVNYSNLETDLEARLVEQANLVGQDGVGVEEALDQNQTTATVEDIEATASAVLSGEVIVEPEKPLQEAIIEVVPEPVTVSPTDIAPEVLIEGEQPTALVKDLHQLDQYIRLQALPQAEMTLAQGLRDRELLVNARQKAILSNMIVEMGGQPGSINALSPYVAQMLHPTSDLVFAQGRLHSAEKQNSSTLSYISYLKDLSASISEVKQHYIKPEYVSNVLLHKPLKEHEIDAGCEADKDLAKQTFSNATFGFGTIAHDNSELVKFVKDVEARTITRENISSDPIQPISSPMEIENSGITRVPMVDFENAQVIQNINPHIADFVVQDRLAEYTKMLLEEGQNISADHTISSPNNMNTSLFMKDLELISQDVAEIKKSTGVDISPMLSDNKMVQEWLVNYANEAKGIGRGSSSSLLGTPDATNMKMLVAASMLEKLTPAVLAYDATLSKPRLDADALKLQHFTATSAIMEFSENYYRTAGSKTYQQANALSYLQTNVPSLNHNDYLNERDASWVMNRANHYHPFKVDRVLNSNINTETQDVLSARNLRDAMALGYAAYNRNKLYTKLGFNSGLSTELEKMLVVSKQKDDQALIQQAEAVFKSINDKVPNFYKNGQPQLNDFIVDSMSMRLALKSDPTVDHTFTNSLDFQTALNVVHSADVLIHKSNSILPYDNSNEQVPKFIANTLNGGQQLSIMFEYMEPSNREQRYEVQPNIQSLSDATHDFVDTAVTQFKNNIGIFESSEMTGQQKLNVITRANSNLSYMRILPSDITNIASSITREDFGANNKISLFELDNKWSYVNTGRNLGEMDNIKQMSFDEISKQVKNKLIEVESSRPYAIFQDVDEYLDNKQYEEDRQDMLGDLYEAPYQPIDGSVPVSVSAKLDVKDLPYVMPEPVAINSSIEAFQAKENRMYGLVADSLRANVEKLPSRLLLDTIEAVEIKKNSPRAENINDHKFVRDSLFIYETPGKDQSHGAFMVLPEYVKPPQDAKLHSSLQLEIYPELKSLKSQLQLEVESGGKQVAPLRKELADFVATNFLPYYDLSGISFNKNAENASVVTHTIDVVEALKEHTEKFEKANIANTTDLHKYMMADFKDQLDQWGQDDYQVVRVPGNEDYVGRYMVAPLGQVSFENDPNQNYLGIGRVLSKEEFSSLNEDVNNRVATTSYYAGPRAISLVLNHANEQSKNFGVTIPVQRAHQVSVLQGTLGSRLFNESLDATREALKTPLMGTQQPPDTVLKPQNAVLAYKPATETEHATVAFLPAINDLNKQKLEEGFVMLSAPSSLYSRHASFKSVLNNLDNLIKNEKNIDFKITAKDCIAGAELEEKKQATQVIDATSNQELISPPVEPKPQAQPKVKPVVVPEPESSQQDLLGGKNTAPRKSSPSADIIEDTGYKIPGAKKDLYAVTLTTAQIEAMTLKQLESMMKLSKMWKKTPVDDAKALGMDVRAYLMAESMRKMMPSQPSYPTAVTTTPEVTTRVAVVYNQVVTDVRNACMGKANLPEMRKALSDVHKAWEANPQFHAEVQRNFTQLNRQMLIFREEQNEIDVKIPFLKEKAKTIEGGAIVSLADLEKLEQLYAQNHKTTHSYDKAFRSLIMHSSFKDRLPKGLSAYSIYQHGNLKTDLTSTQLDMVYNALNPKTETEQTLAKKERQEQLKQQKEEVSALTKKLDDMLKDMASKKSLMATIDDPKLMVNDFSDRNGRNVSAIELQHRFGFKACEFGNYLSQNDRQEAINLAYDGCAALAKMINIPDRMVGFDGLMALANGSRGSTSALAHYESDFRVINLTKKKGFGSFAHEWFHALDNAMMDIETHKNPHLGGVHAPRWLSALTGDTRRTNMIKSDAAISMLKLVENFRKPDYSNVDINGMVQNLKEKEESLKLRANYMLVQLSQYDDRFADGYKEHIEKVLKTRDEEGNSFVKNNPVKFEFLCENEITQGKYNRDVVEVVNGAYGAVYGNENTRLRTSQSDEYNQLKQELQSQGVEEKEMNMRLNQFAQTSRSRLATVIIPKLVDQISTHSAARKVIEGLRDYHPEHTIKAENGRGKANEVMNYMMWQHDTLASTMFHRDAEYLDAMRGGSPYYSMVIEEFARCGEAVTIEGQKEKNMGNNDWLVRRDHSDNNALGADQYRMIGSTRPLGTEREQLVTNFKSFIEQAMPHIQENLPEMRHRDHKLYLRHELSELQSLDTRDTAREDELNAKIIEIEAMTPQEFDASWRKNYQDYLDSDPERKQMAEKLQNISAAKPKQDEVKLSPAM